MALSARGGSSVRSAGRAALALGPMQALAQHRDLARARLELFGQIQCNRGMCSASFSRSPTTLRSASPSSWTESWLMCSWSVRSNCAWLPRSPSRCSVRHPPTPVRSRCCSASRTFTSRAEDGAGRIQPLCVIVQSDVKVLEALQQRLHVGVGGCRTEHRDGDERKLGAVRWDTPGAHEPALGPAGWRCAAQGGRRSAEGCASTCAPLHWILSKKLESSTREVSVLSGSLQRTQSEALLDPLTGLKNRRGLGERHRGFDAGSVKGPAVHCWWTSMASRPSTTR